MAIAPLTIDLIPQVESLMGLGAPYITPRTHSDYWLYATHFSSTCPVAVVNGSVVGAAVAFRSQDRPTEIYIQDVVVHPEHRREGVARALLQSVHDRAKAWRCSRIYLTSEPGNTAAHSTWTSLGYSNVAGDYLVNGISIVRDFKGPGRDRAIYEIGPV